MATISGLPLVERQGSRTTSRPLCVDLDGTLIHTDLLWECLINVLTKSPWVLFLLPLWLFRGRARVKYELARRAEIAVHLLPYNQELIERLQTEKSQGREIVLVTAADRKLAESVATFLGIFDGVLASSPNLNLKGEAKAKALTELYGERGFDYAGDSPA